jgi:hypothetical protein
VPAIRRFLAKHYHATLIVHRIVQVVWLMFLLGCSCFIVPTLRMIVPYNASLTRAMATPKRTLQLQLKTDSIMVVAITKTRLWKRRCFPDRPEMNPKMLVVTSHHDTMRTRIWTQTAVTFKTTEHMYTRHAGWYSI